MRPHSRQFLSMSMLAAVLVGCEAGLPEGDWDNPHDPAGTAYFPPLVDLRDTAIRDGENGVVQSFVRPQVAPVESCRWILDGESLDTRECSLPTRGWASGNHSLFVQSTDIRGVASPPKTVNVWIGNQPPRLETIEDGRVGASATLTRSLKAHDPDGSSVEISWDTVPDRYSIRSDLVQLDPLPGGGSRRVHWRAKDVDGAVSESSFEARFVAAPEPEIQMGMSSSGVWIDSKWRYTVNLPVSAAFSFYVLVHPSEDPGDSLSVTASSTQGSFTCDRAATYPSSTFPLRFHCAQTSGYLSGSSEVTATVTNRFGERSTRSVFVNVQRISS